MIPLKIETLFVGRVVEQNRVEYKEGWKKQGNQKLSDLIKMKKFYKRILKKYS